MLRPMKLYQLPTRRDLAGNVVQSLAVMPVESDNEIHNWCFTHDEPEFGWQQTKPGRGCIQRTLKDNDCDIGSGTIVRWVDS